MKASLARHRVPERSWKIAKPDLGKSMACVDPTAQSIPRFASRKDGAIKKLARSWSRTIYPRVERENDPLVSVSVDNAVTKCRENSAYFGVPAVLNNRATGMRRRMVREFCVSSGLQFL